jgi:flagellar basal body P-ring formation protein FlgA
MLRTLVALLLVPLSARAEALVSTHVLRAGSVIAEADVTLVDAEIPGAVTAMTEAVGQEVKATIYAGRPITRDNIGPEAVVVRNQIVALVYSRSGLAIMAEGRAMARGGVGEQIKVMNTSSHTTVLGVIGADGMVRVNAGQE